MPLRLALLAFALSALWSASSAQDTGAPPEVVVHIVDGELLLDGWEVLVWRAGAAGGDQQTSPPHRAGRPDVDTGMFRVNDLPPGEFRVAAIHQATAKLLSSEEHFAKPGQRLDVELVCEIDPRRLFDVRLTAWPWSRPPEPAVVVALHGRTTGPSSR